MADDTKKPTTNDTAPSINWNDASNKLDALEKEAMTFAGKEGHNPFLWIRNNIAPLRKALAAKDVEIGRAHV